MSVQNLPGSKPDEWSTSTKITPLGGVHSTAEVLHASSINTFHIGPAATAPVSTFPSALRLSNPIHVIATSSGIYPANRASTLSSVVPVFPATEHGRSLANVPVPS